MPQGTQLKKLVSAPQKKAVVEHLVEVGRCSQRHACRIVGLSRSTARYSMRRADDEAFLVERLHKFATKRRGRGYRLAHRELRRDGVIVNHPPSGHPGFIVFGKLRD